jgi:hypothetical protein
VDQVVLACKPKNRLATAMGFLLGGVVPVATYLEAHVDLDRAAPVHSQLAAYLVLGGLLFSAKTVYAWAKAAFGDAYKATGFVVLLEGVMVLSKVPVLPLVLLGFLVAINGIATGCLLSLGRAQKAPKVERAEAVAPKAKARAKRAPRVRAAPVAAQPEVAVESERSVSGVHEILAA